MEVIRDYNDISMGDAGEILRMIQSVTFAKYIALMDHEVTGEIMERFSSQNLTVVDIADLRRFNEAKLLLNTNTEVISERMESIINPNKEEDMEDV